MQRLKRCVMSINFNLKPFLGPSKITLVLLQFNYRHLKLYIVLKVKSQKSSTDTQKLQAEDACNAHVPKSKTYFNSNIRGINMEYDKLITEHHR